MGMGVGPWSEESEQKPGVAPGERKEEGQEGTLGLGTGVTRLRALWEGD